MLFRLDSICKRFIRKNKKYKENIVCLHFKNENDIKYFNNREFKL